jgi:predicted nucleic acid-binding protein
MSDNYFLDTNIFVYLFVNDPDKKGVSYKLISRALLTREGKISSQVIREFLNVGIKKYPGQINELRLFFHNVLDPLCEVFPDSSLIEAAIDIHQDTKYSFYDSLIIAAALDADCRVLYSEDLQSGQIIHGMEIVNPYLPGFQLIQ